MRKQQKIDCEYDELSENNKFNQILKTTVQFLLKHPKVKSNRKAALKRLMLFFSDVEAVDILTIDLLCALIEIARLTGCFCMFAILFSTGC